MSAHITVIGEALIDIVSAAGREPVEHVGGSPTNVAIGLARLGHPTTLVTQLGPDERGRRIATLCASERVELAPGSMTAHHTSTALAEIDALGNAHYVFDFSFDLPAGLGSPTPGHVHTGSIAATAPGGHANIAKRLANVREVATVSYDPNARPALMGTPIEARAMVEELIALCDVVKASDEDVDWLYPDKQLPDVLRHWATLGPRLVVATRGAEGALILVGDTLHELPALRTAVADTVGAGDSFMSGLISGLLDADLLGGPEARARLRAATWPIVQPAIERARRTSSITVSRPGSNPPTREDLDRG
ncbi:MAG: carbohydrate kinase [Propionibacteriaceae bacterium]|nr:carbohydrate kinase [Micropruina sp.]HBX82619.1 carbohydrate kinase [Propionibacteriaceae bacterium]HBY22927.1 carbohydrate kinase [Propionibacteriaceae bacterium]